MNYDTFIEKNEALVKENITLREELAEVKKAFSPTFVRELHAECLNLKRENAALRTELDATRKLLDSHLLRSDLFSYLAWLEDHRDHGDFSVKGKDYLVLASDNTTCWGRTFMEAVQIAEQHDRKLIDAVRKEAKS